MKTIIEKAEMLKDAILKNIEIGGLVFLQQIKNQNFNEILSISEIYDFTIELIKFDNKVDDVDINIDEYVENMTECYSAMNNIQDYLDIVIPEFQQIEKILLDEYNEFPDSLYYATEAYVNYSFNKIFDIRPVIAELMTNVINSMEQSASHISIEDLEAMEDSKESDDSKWKDPTLNWQIIPI